MQVSAVRYADVLVVAVKGRIDYMNAEEFKTALLPHLVNCAPGRDQVVLDLSRLEYVSSAGLRVLMIAAKEVRPRKGRLVAVSLQPVVREIFEISRFTLVFDLFDSVQDALRALSPKAAAMSHTG
ncbi:MAG TPA: STAS domain-containing protein [Burkholderiales bacterium]|nr:STAS domain-containing protein [Burkholderiales bacterium]